MYRSRRLLDRCHALTECTVQIPSVCIGESPDGLEPAHANWSWAGKGRGIKADDCYIAAACHNCHVAIDQGKDLSREEREWYWFRGYARTMGEFFRRGWIKA